MAFRGKLLNFRLAISSPEGELKPKSSDILTHEIYKHSKPYDYIENSD